MGGGMPKENLLIILPFPEDRSITNTIRDKFPNIDVNYHQLKQHAFSHETDLDLPKAFTSSHLLSAEIDHIVNHPLYTQTTIPITTSSGIHGPTISEWVLMSTLVLSKKYKKMYELQKQHKWGNSYQDLPQLYDWVGKRVGIAGYGSIGRQVARVFTSLGSAIYAYTASARPTPASRRDHGYRLPSPHLGDRDGTLPLARYSGTTKADLHAFLSQSLDLLVICLPLTPQTHQLFRAEEFEILARRQSAPSKGSGGGSGSVGNGSGRAAPPPLLLNLSRGALLHTPSLLCALKADQLAGAALDVTDPEPLPPDSELWGLENVVVTPHMSAVTTRYLERALGGVLVENLTRWGSGRDLVNVVRRGRGY